VAIYENEAEAFIGDGASVIAGGAVTVAAEADVPNQITIDDRILDIITTFRDLPVAPPAFDPTIDIEAPDVSIDAPDIDLGEPSVDIQPPTVDLGTTTATVFSVQEELRSG
jgi:hypothetical protein